MNKTLSQEDLEQELEDLDENEVKLQRALFRIEKRRRDIKAALRLFLQDDEDDEDIETELRHRRRFSESRNGETVKQLMLWAVKTYPGQRKSDFLEKIRQIKGRAVNMKTAGNQLNRLSKQGLVICEGHSWYPAKKKNAPPEGEASL